MNQAKIPIEDRGLLFADAVYEVIHCSDNFFVDGDQHLKRLDRSLSALQIHYPYPSHAVLMGHIRYLKRLNRVREGFIYIQVSRGIAPRNHLFPLNTNPSFFICAQTKALVGLTPQKIRTAKDRRWHRCDIKTTNLLPNVLAKQDAHEQGLFDTWGIAHDGFITEGALSNAWIVSGGALQTCSLDENILPGITRARLITLARNMHIPVVVKKFTPMDLYEADEAFSSSSNAPVVPICEVDGISIGNGKVGPIAKALHGAYVQYVKEGSKNNA